VANLATLLPEIKSLGDTPLERSIRDHAMARVKTAHAVAIGQPLFIFIETTWPTRPGMPQNAIILGRISDADDDETAGVEDQIEDQLDQCRRNGWGVGAIAIENDTSAYKTKKFHLPNGRIELRTDRPKFRAIVDRLYNRQNDGLIAHDLDRSVRDMRDLMDLIDVVQMSSPRIKVSSVTGSLRLENDADIAMAQVLTAMNNKSSKDTARRVSRAARRRAQEGKFHGGSRRFGFGLPTGEVDETKEPIIDQTKLVPEEAREIKTWAKAILSGASLASVVRDLNDRGVRPIRSDKWTSRTVKEILLRPSIAGLRDYRGQVLEGVKAEWPEIVTRETWEALVAKLGDSRRNSSPTNQPVWLVSCIAMCGHVNCKGQHHKMVVSGSVSARNNYRSYRCAFGKHNKIRADSLEKFVRDLIVERMARPDAGALIRPVATIDVEALAMQANELRVKLRKIRDLYEEETDMSIGEYRERRDSIKGRLDVVERHLVDASSIDPLSVLVGQEDVGARWDGLDIGRRRAIVERMMSITILSSERRGGRQPDGTYFDKSRVVIRWHV